MAASVWSRLVFPEHGYGNGWMKGKRGGVPQSRSWHRTNSNVRREFGGVPQSRSWHRTNSNVRREFGQNVRREFEQKEKQREFKQKKNTFIVGLKKEGCKILEKRCLTDISSRDIDVEQITERKKKQKCLINERTEVLDVKDVGQEVEKAQVLLVEEQVAKSTLIATLATQGPDITDILFCSHFSELYSADSQGNLKVWNCNSGACTRTFAMGSRIGAMLVTPIFFFVGLTNQVIVSSSTTSTSFSIDVSPHGQVMALGHLKDFLLVGCEDGSTLAFQYIPATCEFRLEATLVGHKGAVTCLISTDSLVCSGSQDNSIRIWRSCDWQCMYVLEGTHSKPISSLLLWDSYLISSALDGDIKVWITADDGVPKLLCSHSEPSDTPLKISISMDLQQQVPRLLCSYSSGTVRVFNLPSLMQTSVMSTAKDVTAFYIAETGLFSAHKGGIVNVWQPSISLSPFNSDRRLHQQQHDKDICIGVCDMLVNVSSR